MAAATLIFTNGSDVPRLNMKIGTANFLSVGADTYTFTANVPIRWAECKDTTNSADRVCTIASTNIVSIAGVQAAANHKILIICD